MSKHTFNRSHLKSDSPDNKNPSLKERSRFIEMAAEQFAHILWHQIMEKRDLKDIKKDNFIGHENGRSP